MVSTTPVYSTHHQPCNKEEEQRWPTSPSLDFHSVRGLQARRHFLLHTLGLPTFSVLHLQAQVELTIYLVSLAPVSHYSLRLKVKVFFTTLFSILLQAFPNLSTKLRLSSVSSSLYTEACVPTQQPQNMASCCSSSRMSLQPNATYSLVLKCTFLSLS